MTDRFHSLTVVLDRNIREDDARDIMEAIKMLKHVIEVEGNIADIEDYVAKERAIHDIRKKLWNVLND